MSSSVLSDKVLKDAVRSAINTKRNALIQERALLNADIRLLQDQLKVKNDKVAKLSPDILALDRQIAALDSTSSIGFAPSFTLEKQDYVYAVPSRSGGREHTSRWVSGEGWRCDCKSGQERGWCWVTKALGYPGVKTDMFSSKPFIVDEKGVRHAVQRFIKTII